MREYTVTFYKGDGGIACAIKFVPSLNAINRGESAIVREAMMAAQYAASGFAMAKAERAND